MSFRSPAAYLTRSVDLPKFQLLRLILTLIHTSTVTHLSTTSNIFVKFGLTKLKICRHTNSIYYYRLVFFFWWKVKRKKRLKNSLCHAQSRNFPCWVWIQANWSTKFCEVTVIRLRVIHLHLSPYLYNLIAAGGESLHKSNAMSGLRGWWIYSSSGWGLSSI